MADFTPHRRASKVRAAKRKGKGHAYGLNKGSVSTKEPNVPTGKAIGGSGKPRRVKPPRPVTSPAHGKGPRPSSQALAHANDNARFKRSGGSGPIAPRPRPTGSASSTPRPRPMPPTGAPSKFGGRNPSRPAGSKPAPIGMRPPTGGTSPLPMRGRPSGFKTGSAGSTATPATSRLSAPESGANMTKPVALAPAASAPKVRGKSAMAPGQIKKRTGAKNASAIARGRKG